MKKKPLIFLLLLGLIVFNSCRKEVTKDNLPLNWDEIEIYTRTQKVSILNETDTATFEFKKYYDGENKYEIENKCFIINKAQKDSIYRLVYKMGEFNNLMQQMIKFIFVELCKNLAND